MGFYKAASLEFLLFISPSHPWWPGLVAGLLTRGTIHERFFPLTSPQMDETKSSVK